MRPTPQVVEAALHICDEGTVHDLDKFCSSNGGDLNPFWREVCEETSLDVRHGLVDSSDYKQTCIERFKYDLPNLLDVHTRGTDSHLFWKLEDMLLKCKSMPAMDRLIAVRICRELADRNEIPTDGKEM